MIYDYNDYISLCYVFSLGLIVNIFISPSELFYVPFNYERTFTYHYINYLETMGKISISPKMICVEIDDEYDTSCIFWNSEKLKNIVREYDFYDQYLFVSKYMIYAWCLLCLSFIFVLLSLILIYKPFIRYKYINFLCGIIAVLCSLLSTLIIIYLSNITILTNIMHSITYIFTKSSCNHKVIKLIFGNIQINYNIYNSYILSTLVIFYAKIIYAYKMFF